MNALRIACGVLLSLAGLRADVSGAEAAWIWSPETAKAAEPAGSCLLRKTFVVKEPAGAHLEIACDNVYEVYFNGDRIGHGDNWQKMTRYDVSRLVRKGTNCVAVKATNDGGPAGVVANVTLRDPQGKPVASVGTGADWRTSVKEPVGWVPTTRWYQVEFDDTKWPAAHVYGPLGMAPWGNLARVEGKIDVFSPPARPPGTFQLIDGDRVVLLGDTLIERAAQSGYIETALTARFPERNVTFRNLGYSGDNVWGRSWAGFDAPEAGFRKRQQQVFDARPSVILLAYGANESFAGPAGLDEFRRGLRDLLASLDRTKAVIVFVLPVRHETMGPSLPNPAPHNARRRLYAGAIREIAAQRKAPVVDLAAALDPKFGPYTDNGIHLTDYGYFQAAAAIARELGFSGMSEAHCSVVLEAGGKRIGRVAGAKLTNLSVTADRVTFSLRDDRLVPPPMPLPKTPPLVASHAKPSDAPQNRSESSSPSARTLRIEGLAEGSYTLRIDGRDVMTTDAASLARGVALPAGPEVDQVERLRRAVVKKNELFFHRWRPQNNTYLFLFRKHEQGNNAVEIPMFDPLVEAKEREIAALRVPAEHRVELTLKR